MFLLKIRQKLSFLGKHQKLELFLMFVFVISLSLAIYFIFRTTGLFSRAGYSTTPISLITSEGKNVRISVDQNGNANTNKIIEGDAPTLIITGDNQPEGLNDIKFFVMKKTNPGGRPEKFGVSGAHGEWDLMPGLSSMYNRTWGSSKTGDQMLERHYAMLSAMGIKWIRIDQSWERVEPSEGNFNFTYVDKIVAAAKRNNLQIMMSLSYIPPWMYKQCKIPTLHTQSPIDANQNGSVYYNRFVRKMVERYKTNGTFDPSGGYGIKYWQIWNEPDSGFWTDCQTGQKGTVENPKIQTKYVAVLKSAYSVIKSIDPQAKVISGGLTHLKPADVLGSLYNQLGGIKSFDIIDVHSYETADLFSSKVSKLAQVRNSNQDASKEIWLSETSFGTTPGTFNDDSQGNYMKQLWGKFEELSPSLNLGKAFWWTTRGYFFSSAPNSKLVGENRHALFENNFYPRKLYFDMGEWLGTIKYKGEVSAKEVRNKVIEVTIPKDMLLEAGEYVIFYASPTKIVTARPFTLIVEKSPIPNCGNLVGSTIIQVNKRAKFTASFYSPQGNLNTQIVAVKDGDTNWTWMPENKKMTGNFAEVSFNWKPIKAGNYTVFCRAWNDGIAECRGDRQYVDQIPRYPCVGPTSSMRVTVVKQNTSFFRGRRSSSTDTNSNKAKVKITR